MTEATHTRKGTRLHVLATDVDDAGAGVGHAGGLRLHVEALAPEESAWVIVEHVGSARRDAWAHIAQRTSPFSPRRVTPACPVFGACGGCAWQHLDLAAQHAAKRARLVAVVGDEALVDAVVQSPSALAYRNRAKYVVGRDPRSGLASLGAYAPNSHAFVRTLGCRVVEGALDRDALRIEALLEQRGLTPYDEARRTGDLRHLVLRTDDAGRVHVLVVGTGAPEAPASIALASAIAETTGAASVAWSRNDREGDAIVGDRPRVLVSVAPLVEELSGVPVEQPHAASFFQVNRAQAHAMYAHVADLLELRRPASAPEWRILDLFSGLGGFTFALARRGASVTAAELDADSVAALTKAAQNAGLGARVAAVALDLGAEAGARELLSRPNDAVVVNPPRKGLGAPLRATLCDAGAPLLVYVSCNPDSLGRDLRVLTAAGYTVGRTTPFDLMPGTAQIEAVVLLTRAPR